jgi:transcriptional regulator CtsR
MLNNKADIVENYILKQLADQSAGFVELSRSELADKISCAPSQISYVLSTRFTHDRGYIVESRRGLGGYIRITIIEDPELEKNFLYNDMISQIDEDTPFEIVKSMLKHLLVNKFITRREFTIIAQTVLNFYRSEDNEKMSASERAKLTRSIFATLANIS